MLHKIIETFHSSQIVGINHEYAKEKKKKDKEIEGVLSVDITKNNNNNNKKCKNSPTYQHLAY
jgi:hypothetical protein